MVDPFNMYNKIRSLIKVLFDVRSMFGFNFPL